MESDGRCPHCNTPLPIVGPGWHAKDCPFDQQLSERPRDQRKAELARWRRLEQKIAASVSKSA
jgi:hypothetical protein